MDEKNNSRTATAVVIYSVRQNCTTICREKVASPSAKKRK